MNNILIRTIEQGKYAIVHPDRVVYIESHHNNCMIHMMDGKQIAVYSSLAAMHRKFPAFLRPLVSYLVNPIHLRGIRHHKGIRVTIKFSNDEKLEFTRSKKFYPSFFKALSSNSGSTESEEL
jgi:DNA-binding LytR/AlgR family response regulator